MGNNVNSETDPRVNISMPVTPQITRTPLSPKNLRSPRRLRSPRSNNLLITPRTTSMRLQIGSSPMLSAETPDPSKDERKTYASMYQNIPKQNQPINNGMDKPETATEQYIKQSNNTNDAVHFDVVRVTQSNAKVCV